MYIIMLSRDAPKILYRCELSFEPEAVCMTPRCFPVVHVNPHHGQGATRRIAALEQLPSRLRYTLHVDCRVLRAATGAVAGLLCVSARPIPRRELSSLVKRPQVSPTISPKGNASIDSMKSSKALAASRVPHTVDPTRSWQLIMYPPTRAYTSPPPTNHISRGAQRCTLLRCLKNAASGCQ